MDVKTARKAVLDIAQKRNLENLKKLRIVDVGEV
jgi:hypothetical protein